MTARADGDVRLRVRAGMQTDAGIQRAFNEDTAYVDPDGRFAVLADGMGGPGSGEVASAMTVEAVCAALEASAAALAAFELESTPSGREMVRAAIEQAVRAAHEAVIERGRVEPDKRGMGSTVDVAVVAGGEAFIAHVGDSRTYLIRDGKALQVTSDHTVAEVLKDAGALTVEEAKASPLRSVLSSAIGLAKMFKIDHAHLELRPGDRLLICSDGLHGYFADEDLAARLSIAELGVALAGMVDEAKARGGQDNITGIVLDVFSLRAGPIAGVPDDALASLVDQSLSEEDSWPLSIEELRPRRR